MGTATRAMTPAAALRRVAAPRAGALTLASGARALERGLLVAAGIGAVQADPALALGAAAGLATVAVLGGRGRARLARVLYAELILAATRAAVEAGLPPAAVERELDDARRTQVAVSEGLTGCAGGAAAAGALLAVAAAVGSGRATLLAAGALALAGVIALSLAAGQRPVERDAEQAVRRFTGRAATLAAAAELIGTSGRGAGALAELQARSRRWLEVAARTDSLPSLAARAPLALAVVGVVVLSRALDDAASALLLAGGALASADAARGAIEVRRGVDAIVAHAEAVDRARLPRGGGAPVPPAAAPIEARQLAVRLGAVEALPPVDLRWEPAELLVVRGPTGAGKSTLLRALLGAVAPSTGELSVGGRSLGELDLVAWRAGVSYLPQQVSLPRRASLGEALAALAIQPDPAAMRRALVRLGAAPDEAEAAPGRPVEAFSTGQLRRALLAALVAEARPFLVLDEPEAALDAETTGRVVALLVEVAAERRVAVATHSDRFRGAGVRVVTLALAGPPGEPAHPAPQGRSS
ncbi:MAG: ATP-binding cassette domain-containing protein [Polyangiaceae bacterium]|nr:ATP-binding cassette domain-containing protein [Polyangiaceae bacterium]